MLQASQHLMSYLFYNQPVIFLQQKNIKTNWKPVASNIIGMEGIISDNYLREDYFQ